MLHAALQIIDQDGVDGLSMRKLARALTQNHDLTNAFVTGDERGSGLDGASHLGRHEDPCDRHRAPEVRSGLDSPERSRAYIGDMDLVSPVRACAISDCK